MRRKELFFFTLGAGIVVAGLWGLSVGSLTSFTAGTPIRASEVNANFTTLRSAIVDLQQPVGVSRLAVGGTIADGKVLKAQGDNLVWGDDATGGASFGASLTGSNATNPGFRVRNEAVEGTGLLGIAGQGGIGVEGQAGNMGAGVRGVVPSGQEGWGVRGISYSNGIGVEGAATAAGGAGVSARATVTGATALLIDGSIGVHGNKPAFIHTVDATNVDISHTLLDSPLLSGDPNAILIVTHVSSVGDPLITVPIGVSYDHVTNRWRIFRADGGPMPLGARFNVLVIKQF